MGERISYLTPEQERFAKEVNWYFALVMMARSHLDPSSPVPLNHDIEMYPEQRLNTYSISGDNERLDLTDDIVKTIEPGYLYERERLLIDPEAQKAIEATSELLDSGDNVYITVPHTDIRDLVFATLMARDLLSLHKGDLDKPTKTGIVTSPAMSVLPDVIRFLKKYANEIFFMLPPTENARLATSHINTGDIRNYTFGAMREQLKHLAQGGNLVGIAPAGTTSKNAAIPEGAIKLLTRGNNTKKAEVPKTYVWAFEVHLAPEFRVAMGQPILCKSKQDVLQALRYE